MKRIKSFIFNFFWKLFSSKRNPKKKVRAFRGFIEKLPVLSVMLWIKKKRTLTFNNLITNQVIKPYLIEKRWRPDHNDLEIHWVYGDDYKTTSEYLFNCRHLHHMLRRRVRRATYNLFRIIPLSFRLEAIPFLRNWMAVQGKLLPKNAIFQYWFSTEKTYTNRKRIVQGYGMIRLQWMISYASWKYFLFHVCSPLIQKHLNYTPWSNYRLQRRFTIFTVLDSFIPIISNRFKRYNRIRFKPFKQLYNDLVYGEELIDKWHSLREGTYPPFNQFYDMNYYTKIILNLDQVENELEEFEFDVLLRLQRTRRKLQIFKMLYIIFYMIMFFSILYLFISVLWKTL